MKLTTIIVLGILLLIVQGIACKKPDIKPPVQDTSCQITSMTYGFTPTGTLNTATVNYNSFGNPISWISTGGGTGNPSSIFIYDQYNRLKDFLSIYRKDVDPDNLPDRIDFEYSIRYVYADNKPMSMPVRDTFRMVGYVLGGASNGRFIPLGGVSRVDTLIYDSQGRIVPATGLDANGNLVQGEKYDSNGNLILPGITYDNKKNFRQTNKIWMLVDKNFSKNNAYQAITYNENGYPTLFPQPVPPRNTLDIFLAKTRYIKTMEYACSVQNGQ